LTLPRNWEISPIWNRETRIEGGYTSGCFILSSDIIREESVLEQCIGYSEESVWEQCIGYSEVKKNVLDRKYPHCCFNQSCNRELRFQEVLNAIGNNQIRFNFYSEILEYLQKHYSFNHMTLSKWSMIFAEYEFYKHIKKVWKSPHARLLCCNCNSLMLSKKLSFEQILNNNKIYEEMEKKWEELSST